MVLVLGIKVGDDSPETSGCCGRTILRFGGEATLI